jgi:hypothetical protein
MFDPEFIVPLGFFLAVVAIIKIVSDAKARNRLIDKGLAEDKARVVYQMSTPLRALSSLKWGMILVGIGLAIFIGELFPYRISDEVTWGLMFVFAGIGFLVYYPMAQKRQKEMDDQLRQMSGQIKKDNQPINP